MSKHTAERWEIVPITDEYGKTTFEVMREHDDGALEFVADCAEDVNVAHLIASAPELLEACYAARVVLKHYGCPDKEALLDIEKAIAKAEGK